MEEIRYPAHDDTERKELFVVLHNKTVWKNVFFTSEEQAFNAVTMFHKGQKFNRQGKTLVGKSQGHRFTVHTVLEYTKMDDIRYCQEWG